MSSNMDDFGPILSPLVKAHRLKAFVDDLNWQHEQRDMQRQQMKLQIEQMQHQRMTQDIHTGLALRSAGFDPETPAGERQQAGAEKLFGPAQPGYERPEIMGPGGQKYRAPSRHDLLKQQGEESDIKVEQAKKIAEARVEAEEGPLVDVPVPTDVDPGPFGTQKKIKVRQAHQVDALAKLFTDKGWTTKTETNDAGDVTTIAVNPRTKKQQIIGVVKGAGKTKAQKSAQVGMSEKAMKAWQHAQAVIDDAESDSGKMAREGLDMFGKDGETRKRRAKQAVDEAVAAYPNDLESYVDANGVTKIKRKDGGGAQASGAGGAASAGEPNKGKYPNWKPGDPIPASALESFLKHPAIIKHGIKDVNELRKFILSRPGGAIDEKQ